LLKHGHSFAIVQTGVASIAFGASLTGEASSPHAATIEANTQTRNIHG
jgi:hypothetical protein